LLSIFNRTFFELKELEKPMPNIGKAVTRVGLYDAVYRKVGLSRSESSALVELVLKEISDSVARGETVKLSSFGTFTVHKKGQRMGRNPKTGVDAPISPRRVVVFKASAIMKQRIARVDEGVEVQRFTLFRGDETHPRSILKAISWRTLGTLDTFATSWFLTGKVAVAGSIATLEVETKVAWYYLHERMWAAVAWGRR
jgi:integration host factor subunit alpha